MHLRDAFKQLKYNILSGNASLLAGPPGFGKTDLHTKAVAWWKGQNPDKRIGFSCFFLATQTPLGCTGVPWKGTSTWKKPDGTEQTFTITDPAIPVWYMATCLDTGERLPACCFDSVYLVIEEWGQGAPETKRAAAEILRAGGTPPFYLPPGSPRCANTNVDARDGVTKEFDFVIGRRGEIPITGDTTIWLEDFADRPYWWQGKQWLVSPFTKAWAKAHPDLLFEPKPQKQAPWCNPRSLTNADRFVQAATADNNGMMPVDDSAFQEALAGHIGHPAMASYASEAKFMSELPQIDAVVLDPVGTPIPTRGDLQMLMAYMLAGNCQPDQLAPVIQYMSRNTRGEFTKDMTVAFVSSILRRNYNEYVRQPAMKAWISKNGAHLSAIAALS